MRHAVLHTLWLAAAGAAACSSSGGLPPPECVALDPTCAQNQASVVVEVRGIPRDAPRVWAAAGGQERSITDVPQDRTVTFYFFDVAEGAPVAAGTGERTQGRTCALGNHGGGRSQVQVDLSADGARCQDVGTDADAGAGDAGVLPDAGDQADAGDEDEDGGHDDDDDDGGNHGSGGNDDGGREPEDDGGRRDSGR